MDRTLELGQAPVGRLLFRYAAPAIVAMTVNSLYNLVDAIFVGQGVGPLGLGGLAVSFPIQMFFLAAAQVVGIGSASLISRSLGAGNHDRANHAAGGSFLLVVLIGVTLAAAAYALLNPLLRLFGATENILPYASDYMRTILFGSPLFALAVSTNNVVRSEGNIKVVMIGMVLGAAINTVLDPIFIFGLDMGMRGAALATVIAQACSAAWLAGYFLSGRSLLRIARRHLWPNWDDLPQIFSVGSASLGRVASGSLLAIVINHSVTHYGDEMHLGVIGACNRLLMFTLMPLIGLIQGNQPIVGFNYGAKNAARVRRALWVASSSATLFCFAVFILLEAVPEQVLRLFGAEPDFVAEGARALRMLALGLPVVGFQIVGAAYFQAIGKAFPALFLSMSRQILFLLPIVLVLPLWFGLDGLWASFPIADGLSAVVTLLWLLHAVRAMDREFAVNGTPIQESIPDNP